MKLTQQIEGVLVEWSHRGLTIQLPEHTFFGDPRDTLTKAKDKLAKMLAALESLEDEDDRPAETFLRPDVSALGPRYAKPVYYNPAD